MLFLAIPSAMQFCSPATAQTIPVPAEPSKPSDKKAIDVHFLRRAKSSILIAQATINQGTFTNNPTFKFIVFV